MKPYEFCIILNPTPEDQKKGEAAKIVAFSKEPFLAPDDQTAAMLAGREIPEEYLPQVARLKVHVRPF